MTECAQLRFDIIWMEEQLVELQAVASNGRYRGTTEVYTTLENLSLLAKQIEGFPRRITDVVAFEAGEQGSYAFLSLSFYCVDGVGHTAIHVYMEESAQTSFRPGENHKVSFDLRCEPAAIDKFQEELRLLAERKKESASLLQS